jgi:CHAD domain-containing protein
VKATHERELKLEVAPGFRLPELPGHPLPPRVFTSVYFDTSDYRLAAAGITLRRRVERGGGLWQLKLPRSSGRLELEAPGPASPVPDEFKELLTVYTRGSSLAAVATLRSRREGVRVRDLEGPVADVVLDAVQVLDGRRVVRRFREVEVELTGGDEAALERLGGMLREAGASDGDGRPKLFKALGLPPAASSEIGPSVPASPADHLKAMLAEHLGRVAAHDPGTRLGQDPEELHQMRVATRRLRAMLRAARPMLDPEWVEPLRDELRWLGRALGPVRDLDVLREHLATEIASLDPADQRGGRRLLTSLDRERAETRQAMLEALRSDRYLRLLEVLDDAVRRPKVVDPDVSLETIAAEEFADLQRAVESLGRSPSDEELHAVRIKGKRARYTAELAEPTAGKRATRFVKAARAFQDLLGDHQDAVVAVQRIREWAGRARGARAALVAGQLIERERRRREVARASLPKQWAKLAKRGRKAWQ